MIRGKPLDRDRIQRVLENLVTNAREALAAWGREKKIAIRARAEGGCLTVRVETRVPEGGAAFTVLLPLPRPEPPPEWRSALQLSKFLLPAKAGFKTIS